MKLILDLEHRLVDEASMFQAQLLREDIARLRKLEALMAPDEEAFVRAGLRLGWTQGDARTGEIREPLEVFLRAVHANDEPRIAQAWAALHRARMERLLGCLSTPVPKPVR